MFIDVHTHALHPKIAHKVVEQLDAHYHIKPVGNGLIEDLLEHEQRAGIDKMVVLCAATAPAQVIPANNWILQLQQQHPEVIGFGTLHPEYADWEKELDRLRANGIKGLKFHPEFQSFWLDDPALLPIIEAAQEDFVFLFHIGDRAEPKDNPSCPMKLARILQQFPKARVIAPHMGGYLHWEYVLDVLAGKNVYLDTSSAFPFIEDGLLGEIVKRHPREKILFGSDYPLFSPEDEIELVQKKLGLSSTEMEQILSNACDLLY